VGVLTDASAKQQAATVDDTVGAHADREIHKAVAALINNIIAGGNSVRRI